MSIDINISNYEAYLYCYVDGELDAAEQAALEAFMEANPQTRQELDVLLAARLTPEPVVFDAKASLYRSTEISLQHYEPFLLGYIDGELGTSEAARVEAFAATNPTVQQELEIWKATRLQPDMTVRFDNKASLYRHTTKIQPIRPAYWWAAAAAVVAGALFFLLPAGEQPADQPVAAVVKPAPLQPAAPTPPAAEEKTLTDQSVATLAAAKPVAAPRSAIPQARKTPVAVVKETSSQVPPQEKTIDLTSISSQTKAVREPQVVQSQLTDGPKGIPEHQADLARNKPVITSVADQPGAIVATAPPAANPPGELIMSVTGNGLESKVLDKVTNVARLFSRKRNK